MHHLKKKFLGVIFAAVLSALFIPISSWAAGYIITSIANSQNGGRPVIDNGQVVWGADDASGVSQIFFYDIARGGDPTQLTHNTHDSFVPSISNGQVVFWDSNNGQIFFYDTKKGGAPIQIPRSGDFSIWPSISNGQVVWWGDDINNIYQIFFYDTNKGGSPIPIHNSQNSGSPSISSGQVIWVGDNANGVSQIFFYDIARGGDPIQLTNGSYGSFFPSISNGQVVWYQYDDNYVSQIFFCDTAKGATPVQLTNGSQDSADPSINNGQIVWDGYDADGVEQIFLATPTPLEMLDGAEFSVGKELTYVVASGGRPVTGVAADGITRLLLRVQTEAPGSVEFSLPDANAMNQQGQIKDIGQASGGVDLVKNTVSTSQGDMAFAVYQAPDNFVRQGFESGDGVISERTVKLHVKFTPSGGGASSFELDQDIRVLRPPVLLVHGLWSSPGDCWTNFSANLKTKISGIYVDFADYSATNASSLATNKLVVSAALKALRAKFKQEKVAMIRADVICHSMGGDLARICTAGSRWPGEPNYLSNNNFWAGPINRLITIDTPHYGSFMADAAVDRLQNLSPMNQAVLINLFSLAQRPLTKGAIDDLTTYSSGITSLKSVTARPAACHTVVGDYIVPGGNIDNIANDHLKLVHQILRFYGADTRPYIINGHSDLVVETSSQQSGLSGSATNTHPYDHIAAPDQSLDEVVGLLNANPNGDGFAQGYQ